MRTRREHGEGAGSDRAEGARVGGDYFANAVTGSEEGRCGKHHHRNTKNSTESKLKQVT